MIGAINTRQSFHSLAVLHGNARGTDQYIYIYIYIMAIQMFLSSFDDREEAAIGMDKLRGNMCKRWLW